MKELLTAIISTGGKYLDWDTQKHAREHIDAWVKADARIEELERMWPDIDDVEMGFQWKEKRRAEKAMSMMAQQMTAKAAASP